MSRYLLDTHAALFWWSNPDKLGLEARRIISHVDSTIIVSAVSAFEVAIKHQLGKLGDIGNPSDTFLRLMQRNGFVSIEVTIEHGLRAGALAGPHRDPFDRLLAAQALIEDVPLITRDREIAAFGCRTIW